MPSHPRSPYPPVQSEKGRKEKEDTHITTHNAFTAFILFFTQDKDVNHKFIRGRFCKTKMQCSTKIECEDKTIVQYVDKGKVHGNNNMNTPHTISPCFL
jgi:hypothetical protein